MTSSTREVVSYRVGKETKKIALRKAKAQRMKIGELAKIAVLELCKLSDDELRKLREEYALKEIAS